MNEEAAHLLIHLFRRAVADTCKANAMFSAHLTGTSEEYQAMRAVLEEALRAEVAAYRELLAGMLGVEAREEGKR